MATRDWLWIILLGLIWGCSFFFNAILIRELGPLWVSAGRVGVGALGCWIFFLAQGKKLPNEKSLYLHFFILGTMSYAVPFALFPLSQAYLASGIAAIINAMTPIMTVVVSHFWRGGEKASLNKSMGVIAGFIGVAILAVPALSDGGSTQIWAIGLCLFATLCYAFALNYTRSFKHVDPTVLAACALTGATLSAVPAAAIAHGVPHLVTFEGWGALLGIGLLSTAFTFQVMYRILPRVGATNFSTTTFIAPVVAILLGLTLLKESIELVHILGMICIFAGLLLIDGRLMRTRSKVKA